MPILNILTKSITYQIFLLISTVHKKKVIINNRLHIICQTIFIPIIKNIQLQNNGDIKEPLLSIIDSFSTLYKKKKKNSKARRSKLPTIINAGIVVLEDVYVCVYVDVYISHRAITALARALTADLLTRPLGADTWTTAAAVTPDDAAVATAAAAATVNDLLLELPLLAAHRAEEARLLRVQPLHDAVDVEAMRALAPHLKHTTTKMSRGEKTTTTAGSQAHSSYINNYNY